MTARNNRDAYIRPTPEQVEAFRKDAQCIQWRDIAKSAFLFTGENLSFDEVHKMMKPDIAEHAMIDGKPVWGWWRLTDPAYAKFAGRGSDDISHMDQ
jgi:hypothetical protein